MDFHRNETTDGVRWSWNVLPCSRLEASRMVIPIGCMYTPLANIQGLPVLEYEPVECRNCRAILNPFCHVDFRAKTWTCPFCFTRSAFPPSYAGISENNQPAELYPQYSTVEYVLYKQKLAPPPCFLLVIDTCMDTDELETLKDSILQSLELIPENAYVGLITFGTTVQVYELAHSECSKAYVFRGDKAPTFEQVQDQLGLKPKFQTRRRTSNVTSPHQERTFTTAGNTTSRFLLPLSECELTITSIIEELQFDPWPVKAQERSRRCTGVALSVATSLLECAFKGFGSRIVTFLGGPCTIGEGTIVGMSFKEQIRLHNDIREGKAPHFKKAVTFYQDIAKRLVANGHCVDVFAAHLDQIGVMELRSCCENTGGDLILTDTFENPIFKESYKRYFKMNGDYLAMAFNAKLDVKTSRELSVCGAIGPVAPVPIQNQSGVVSENEIGYGGTTSWKINALNNNTTVSLYFDVVNQQANSGQSKNRYFQFTTMYQHSSGQYRLRVTTQALKWVGSNQWNLIGQGFDQEVAAVLMARYAVFKAETEHLFDVLRWLDRNLIRLVAKFGEYQKDNPNSLNLSLNFSIFPQFMYHLRRSPFLRVFNTSPDETTFYRLWLNRENTTNCLTMIQPTLHSYSFNEVPHPVLLDSVSVQPDVILLMDTFFQVLIHYGEQIADWRDAGYHEQENYKHFKQLLELPKIDAKQLMEDRYPFPKFIECDQFSSQARFLAAKVNPSTTHHTSQQSYGQQSFAVLTDDASFQVFMTHLKKLAVSM